MVLPMQKSIWYLPLNADLPCKKVGKTIIVNTATTPSIRLTIKELNLIDFAYIYRRQQMVYEIIDTRNVSSLFDKWEETLILSCLQGVMGKSMQMI